MARGRLPSARAAPVAPRRREDPIRAVPWPSWRSAEAPSAGRAAAAGACAFAGAALCAPGRPRGSSHASTAVMAAAARV